MTSATISILTDRKSVSLFIDSVIEEADKNKGALGFYASAVFHEFAAREQLFVAASSSDGAAPSYAGHILFDCRYPRCSVLQVNVLEAMRRNRIGRALLRSLREHLAPHGFSSIVARVAEDLTEANSFYKSEGFYVQSVLPGGASRGRIILRRVMELPTPQLFSSSGLSESDPLGTSDLVPVEKAVFLLDLNVIRDISPRRPRTETVIGLFKGERRGLYVLGVSSEARAELRRTAVGKTDPLTDFVRVFPEFLLPDNTEIQTLSDALLRLIFPSAQAYNAATPQQKSDVRHVATVVHFRLAGLVTSDDAILRVAHDLESRYRIKVVSPDLLTASLPEVRDVEDVALPQGSVISLRRVRGADLVELTEFLRPRMKGNESRLQEWLRWDLESAGFHYAAEIDSRVVGYAGLCLGLTRGSIVAHVAVDESIGGPEEISSALLRRVEDHLTDGVGHTIHIDLPPDQAIARETALSWGYRGPSSGGALVKIYLARVVTGHCWSSYRQELAELSGLRLPTTPPRYSHPDQQLAIITPRGEQAFHPLELLESLLRPIILALPGRPAVITPIRREYSSRLLEYSPQWSLLARDRPSLFPVKHYVGGAQVRGKVDRGMLMLFL